MRGAALIAALGALGCTSGQYVLVDVHAVPGGVTALVSRSALDEQPAQSSESFDAPSGGFGSDTSFVLQLPSKTRGRLSVAVEAWVSGCAVASQSADLVLTGEQLTLDVTLAAVTPQDCSGQFVHPPDMVRVPGATFTMGCNAAIDTQCETDEQPAHAVTLSSFFIDRTEVSAFAYQACRAHGGCGPALVEEPAATTAEAFVTWDQASAYCTARGKRLPTEAEWELAARGTDGRIYPWGNDPPSCDRANYMLSSGAQCYQDNAGIDIAPIDHGNGASPYGALNMAGNLEEWVADWYVTRYPAGAATNPTGPPSGVQRVLRGGSFISSAAQVRATRRNANAPDASSTTAGLTPDVNSSTFGIRCARAQ